MIVDISSNKYFSAVKANKSGEMIIIVDKIKFKAHFLMLLKKPNINIFGRKRFKGFVLSCFIRCPMTVYE